MSERENLDHSQYGSWGFADMVVTAGPGTPTPSNDGVLVFKCRGTCGMLKLVNPPKDAPRSPATLDPKLFEEVFFEVRSKDCNAEVATRLEKRIVAAVKAWYEVRDSVVAYDPLLEIARLHEALMCRQAKRMYEMPKDDFLAMLGRGPGKNEPLGPQTPVTFGNVDIADPKGARKLKDAPSPAPVERKPLTVDEIRDVMAGNANAMQAAKKVQAADPTGICRVCNGVTHPVYEYHGEVVFGGPPQPRSIASWNCQDCGIMYAKQRVHR